MTFRDRSRRIGGPLDYSKFRPPRHDSATREPSADAARNLHRPHYAAEIAAAIRELTAQGLRPYDISISLGIGIDAVQALLTESHDASSAARGDEAAAMHAAAWTKSP